MSTERTPKSDKELWQSLATDGAVAPAAVSDLDFAAWLEGRLSETQAARIDTAVAADAELRRTALELADILGKPLPPLPPRMAVRAQALVGFEAERQAGRGTITRRRSWLAALLPDFSGGFSLQRGAMAGIVALIATVGFMLGGGLGDSFAQQKYASTRVIGTTLAKALGSDTSNELADLFSDQL